MAERLTEFGVLTPSVLHANASMSNVHQRILAADDPQELGLQLQVETLAVLHQIRRILMWTLVIIPVVLVALALVLLVIQAA